MECYIHLSTFSLSMLLDMCGVSDISQTLENQYIKREGITLLQKDFISLNKINANTNYASN
ncbi:6746_t:CDS:1, partial [Dentiscutata heterogama]